MWANSRSHCASHQRPATLETSAPVTSKALKTSTTPSPGIWRSGSIRVPAESGVNATSPVNKPPKMASSSPTSHNNTQMVMANGNQTSKPVSRYFLIGTRFPAFWLGSVNGRRKCHRSQQLVAAVQLVLQWNSHLAWRPQWQLPQHRRCRWSAPLQLTQPRHHP